MHAKVFFFVFSCILLLNKFDNNAIIQNIFHFFIMTYIQNKYENIVTLLENSVVDCHGEWLVCRSCNCSVPDLRITTYLTLSLFKMSGRNLVNCKVV